MSDDPYSQMERLIREMALRMDPKIDVTRIRVVPAKKGDDFCMSTNVALVMANWRKGRK